MTALEQGTGVEYCSFRMCACFMSIKIPMYVSVLPENGCITPKKVFKFKDTLLKVYFSTSYLLYIYFYFFKMGILLYWGIVDLQCCVSYRYTGKWFSYTYINLYIYLSIYIYIYIYILFQIPLPHRSLQNIEYSFPVLYTRSCWLSILYIVVCIC